MVGVRGRAVAFGVTRQDLNILRVLHSPAVKDLALCRSTDRVVEEVSSIELWTVDWFEVAVEW